MPTIPELPRPWRRPRRMRRNPVIRGMVRETRLTPDRLVLPLFLIDGENVAEPIGAMPGHSRLSVDLAAQKCREAVKAGVGAFALFPAVDAGLKIAVGTDALGEPTHGINARELELMVSYGFTPMEAIVAATKTASEVCQLDAKIGTVEPGKLADLLVVDGDPLTDINCLREANLLAILKGGAFVKDALPGA